MRFAVITYQAQHLKTEQILTSLHGQGHRNLDVYALPFIGRPGRDVLFQHRPDMTTGRDSRNVAASLGYGYVPVSGPEDIPTDFDALVIAGAGILPGALVNNVKTVNAHPGLIPAVRGLDSFKWSILDGAPLGVTLHLVDAEVDAGEVLAWARTPVYRADTIADLAQRHYGLEIELLSGFLEYLDAPMPPDKTLSEGPARKRMPKDTETRMLDAFDAYKDKHAED